jgi:uncharacterized Tic20 family protein
MSVVEHESHIYEPVQDERTFACISHLTVFVSSFGLFIAIGLWIYLRNKYPYAAFQAAQAVLFQVIVMILTFFLIFAFVAVFFGAFGIGLASGIDVEGDAFIALAVALAFGLVALVLIISIALYGYAIYAAVRSYQGRPFRIPGIALIADAISPMPRMNERRGS